MAGKKAKATSKKMGANCAVPKGVPKSHRDRWTTCKCLFCKRARKLAGM